MSTPSGLRLKMLSALGVRRRGDRAVELLNYLPEAEGVAAGELMQEYAAQPDREYALEQMIRQMAASERFSSLAEIHPAWFLEQLRSEPPRVIGLILRSLPSKHLRFVLENLPPMLRARIPNLVESFAASKPVLDAIRRRFERRFLPMRITRAIEHPGFDHLYFLKGDDLAAVVREIGLVELAVALSGMSSKALHIIYNRLELKEARRLQRRIKGLSGISPELHRQARFNLLEIEGRHEGAEQMLASVGLAALACAVADEYDGLVKLLMQKLPRRGLFPAALRGGAPLPGAAGARRGASRDGAEDRRGARGRGAHRSAVALLCPGGRGRLPAGRGRGGAGCGSGGGDRLAQNVGMTGKVW